MSDTFGSGKTAIITGGTKGIGRAIARHLTTLGYKLALSYSSDEAAAEETQARIREVGGDCLVVRADSRSRSDLESLFEQARARFGDIYAVIANAGVENTGAPFAQMSEDALDRVVDVNVKGTFLTLQQAARTVLDGGRVIATASTIASYPPPGAGAYAASKAAVRLMVEVLALELGHRGITVNSLSPGAVEGSGMFTNMTDADRKTFTAATPMGRLPKADDLTASVAFLLSGGASLVTAHHLEVTAGFRV